MDDDRLYSITVKTMYLVALLLNGAVLWDQTASTTAGVALRKHLAAVKAATVGRMQAAAELQKQTSWVIHEAQGIVADAQAETTPDA